MLFDSLRALLEVLLACQALWLRLAPIFALQGAAQHMPSECLTFAQVLACCKCWMQCQCRNALLVFQGHNDNFLLRCALAYELQYS